MSKLKLSPNQFLEVNELSRLVKFLSDDGYKLIFKNLFSSFGIARGQNSDYFKVSYKEGSDNVIIVNSGIAIDENVNIIVLKNNKEIELPSTVEYDKKYWVVISHSTTHDEEGTVSVSEIGNLRGNGTSFLSVLRGQPNFPTKIKFTSSKNTEEYEVVEVTSDTDAVIAGDFVEESGLNYQVIGTFTPGFQPDDENKMIYEYDSCNIEIVQSESAPELSEGQFILASFMRSNGVSVNDERSRNYINTEFHEEVENETDDNPLACLLRTSIKNDKFIDIQFEWGYKVTRYELVTTSNNNIFNILMGESKYLSTGSIPNGFFKGWILLNRANMKSVVIDDSVANSLYVGGFNSSMVSSSNNDFIIVPNFSEFEIVFNLTGTNYNDDDTDYVFKFSMENIKSRVTLPLEYDDTKIEMKYRMLGVGETTEFKQLSNLQFINVKGEKETLGNSSFSVTINRPEKVQRNYS